MGNYLWGEGDHPGDLKLLQVGLDAVDTEGLGDGLNTPEVREGSGGLQFRHLDDVFVLAEFVEVRVGLAQVCGQLLQGPSDGHHHRHSVRLQEGGEGAWGRV